jgi:peptidoglycan/LPS O-acetylase OafA/YrhL
MRGTRYEVLDGLRGTAAMLVVVLHLCGTFRVGAQANPLHHGYLAVDFFYMLSGFVIGHACDRRWPRMGLGGFFARRLVRLHPLVLLGAGLGAASYLFVDVGMEGAAFWPKRFIENAVLTMLLPPAPGLPRMFGMTHALNPPSWSLTQEYLANIAYGLIGPRTGGRRLVVLVAVFGAAELALALGHDGVDVGWAWSNLWLAPARRRG